MRQIDVKVGPYTFLNTGIIFVISPLYTNTVQSKSDTQYVSDVQTS